MTPKNDSQKAKDDTKNGEYDTKNDTKNGILQMIYKRLTMTQ